MNQKFAKIMAKVLKIDFLENIKLNHYIYARYVFLLPLHLRFILLFHVMIPKKSFLFCDTSSITDYYSLTAKPEKIA